MNGKGPRYRPVNQKKYEAGYDKAFRLASEIKKEGATSRQDRSTEEPSMHTLEALARAGGGIKSRN